MQTNQRKSQMSVNVYRSGIFTETIQRQIYRDKNGELYCLISGRRVKVTKTDSERRVDLEY